MKYSGEKEPQPKTSTKVLLFMYPSATGNILSKRANKGVLTIWWKIRKHYFNVRYMILVMKSSPYKNNLFLKSWFEESIETQSLWVDSATNQIVWQSKISPKVHCTVLMILLNVSVWKVRKVVLLLLLKARVHTHSAIVSSTIIAISQNMTFISKGDNKSKTWQTSLPHHQCPCFNPIYTFPLYLNPHRNIPNIGW